MSLKNTPTYYRSFILLFLLALSCIQSKSNDLDVFKKTDKQSSINSTFIDPIGTYIYDSIVNDNSPYLGTIEIKLEKDSSYFVDFNLCKGPPSYNMGSFQELLLYEENHFYYTCEYDSSCIITLQVCDTGMHVNHQAENLNWSCGFGHAVVAHGFFIKM